MPCPNLDLRWEIVVLDEQPTSLLLFPEGAGLIGRQPKGDIASTVEELAWVLDVVDRGVRAV